LLAGTKLNIFFYDFTLYLSGFVTGFIVLLVFFAFIVRNVYISPHIKSTDLNLVKVVDEKKNMAFVYINPVTFLQTLETIISFGVWCLKGRRENIIFQSSKKQKAIVCILIFLSAVLTTYALWELFTFHKY
jgi:hypothetical protein